MYKALILGSGQIAGGYDSPQDDGIITHAHAYLQNPETELLGFYDINFEQAEKMAQKWGVSAIKELSEIKEADIISVCTPDFCHLNSVKDALKLNPKLIILEKPISNTQKDADKIYKISKKTPIMVNYTRNFVHEFQDLASDIKQGKFGNFITGNGYYGKGYIHIGSHMRSLLELLLGKISKVKKDKKGFQDYTKDDLSVNAVLYFGDKTFKMTAVPCTDYNIFELDLMFSKARIRISELGNKIEIFNLKEKENQSGYMILNPEKTYNTEMKFAMKNAVQNAINYLNGKEELYCTVGRNL